MFSTYFGTILTASVKIEIYTEAFSTEHFPYMNCHFALDISLLSKQLKNYECTQNH
jgi:hypothetical protein